MSRWEHCLALGRLLLSLVAALAEQWVSARLLGVSRSLTRAADGLPQARDPAMTGRSRRPVCRAERLAGGRR